ncbi:MAG: hypothetical protein KIH64_014410 [Mycobacterium sp.]|nr:hypothetical protein [Mycobacterium sp.]
MKTGAPREGRGWPSYLLGGRLRTSTAALLIAFFALWWLYETYVPNQQPAQVPASEVVPPGFIPDPDYTWAPRTDVQRHDPTTTTTTSTTTSTTPTTPTTSVTVTPTPSSTAAEPGGPTPPPAPRPSPTEPAGPPPAAETAPTQTPAGGGGASAPVPPPQ